MATRVLNRRETLAPFAAPRRDGRSIFVTGGIGDVLTVSCFLDVPSNLEVIYYATPKFAEVREYLRQLAPHARHVCLWDDWLQRDCFFSLAQFMGDTGKLEPQDALDWSILTIFHQPLTFRGWPLRATLGGLRDLLPRRYAVLAPFTTDKRSPRDFTDSEINAVLRHAQLPLVLLNAGHDRLIDNVINLQNQTSVLGSIAVTRGADLFIGVDSSMSVVATKCLPAERLCIKSDSANLRAWRHLYYAPHTAFPFVVTDVAKRLTELR